jgi:hypothetical protein
MGPILTAIALLTTCASVHAARRVRPLVVSPYLTRSGYLNGSGRSVNGRTGVNGRAGVNRRNGINGRAGNARRSGSMGRTGRAGGSNGNSALKRGKNSNFRRDVPVDLATDLQSLQSRHSSLVAKLPTDLRRLDSRALAVVTQLPRVAQYSYLSTVEDYETLTPDEQGRFGKVVKGLADLGPREAQFIQAATPSFSALEVDKDRLHRAVTTPHATCFKLQEELDRLPAR